LVLAQVSSRTPKLDILYSQYLERDFEACANTLTDIETEGISSWNEVSKELYWSLYCRFYLKIDKNDEKYNKGLIALGAFTDTEDGGQLAKNTKEFLTAYRWYQQDILNKADSTLHLLTEPENKVYTDPILQAEIQELVSEVKMLLRDREEAIASNKVAIKIWEELEASARVAYASRHLGDYFTDIREPNEALLYFEKARSNYSKAYGELHADVASCYASMGLVHGNIRNFNYSAAAFKKGIHIYETLSTPPLRELADAYDDLGFVYCNYNPDSAILYIKKGLRLRRKIFREPHQQIARSYNSLGTYFRYLQNPILDSSIYYFSKELAIWEELEPEEPMNSIRYFELARTCMNMEDFANAQLAFRRGLQFLTGDKKAPYVDSLPAYASLVVPSLGLDAMFFLSQYYERLQVAKKDTSALYHAMRCADLTSEINDSIWNRYSLTGAKLNLSNLIYPTLGYGISAAFDAYYITGNTAFIERALHYAESRKAMMLSESFKRSLSDTILVPKEVRKQEARINYKLSYYRAEQEKIGQQPQNFDTSYARQVAKNVIVYLHRRDSLAGAIKKNWPNYLQKKTLLHLPDIYDVRAKLDSNTVLLTYSVHIPSSNDSTDEINCFLITREGVRVQRLNLDSSLGTDIVQLRSLIAKKDYDNYIALAHKLYQLLFAPLHITKQNVVIIPEGSLAEVPFDALIKTVPSIDAPKDFSQLDYLLRHKSVSYANSVWYWYYTHENRSEIQPEVFGVAPFK